MKTLIEAAEAALKELHSFHDKTSILEWECPGVEHCATAAAIRDLELAIGAEKLESGFDEPYTAAAKPVEELLQGFRLIALSKLHDELTRIRTVSDDPNTPAKIRGHYMVFLADLAALLEVSRRKTQA